MKANSALSASCKCHSPLRLQLAVIIMALPVSSSRDHQWRLTSGVKYSYAIARRATSELLSPFGLCFLGFTRFLTIICWSNQRWRWHAYANGHCVHDYVRKQNQEAGVWAWRCLNIATHTMDMHMCVRVNKHEETELWKILLVADWTQFVSSRSKSSCLWTNVQTSLWPCHAICTNKTWS